MSWLDIALIFGELILLVLLVTTRVQLTTECNTRAIQYDGLKRLYDLLAGYVLTKKGGK